MQDRCLQLLEGRDVQASPQEGADSLNKERDDEEWEDVEVAADVPGVGLLCQQFFRKKMSPAGAWCTPVTIRCNDAHVLSLHLQAGCHAKCREPM